MTKNFEVNYVFGFPCNSDMDITDYPDLAFQPSGNLFSGENLEEFVIVKNSLQTLEECRSFNTSFRKVPNLSEMEQLSECLSKNKLSYDLIGWHVLPFIY